MIDKSEQIKRELPKKIFLWEYNKIITYKSHAFYKYGSDC